MILPSPVLDDIHNNNLDGIAVELRYTPEGTTLQHFL